MRLRFLAQTISIILGVVDRKFDERSEASCERDAYFAAVVNGALDVDAQTSPPWRIAMPSISQL